jgi:DivIVA domain-containing protein
MKPEEIQNREFLVGLRGYDKDEVQSFLSEVALEYEALQRENDELRSSPQVATSGSAGAAVDEFESLGSSVAAILRAAKESASQITAGADDAALQVRDEAEHYSVSLRQQAEETLAAANETAESLRHRVSVETEEMRRAAAVALADARAEADRILREANERAGALAIEAEARIRNQTEAMFAEAEARVDDARRREQQLRVRLRDAADELSLAILALGDDDAESNESSDDGRGDGTPAQDHAWS